MADFERSVFVNCPFDADYRQLLIALVFTIKYLGFVPRLSLQSSDSGNTRITKIVELVRTSRFGIHDLSRIVSTAEDEYYRMNMPFELGIDYGCKKLKGGKWKRKKLLVLEKEQYRYQAALSDFAGSDIQWHDDDALTLVKVVRNWFMTEELGTGPSHTKIWYDFNDFTAELERSLSAQGYGPDDYGTVPIPEVMAYMDSWFK